MENLYEKVAYIKGLSEGFKLEKNSKEGRLINEMIELLELMSEELSELQYGQEYLEGYVDLLDEDLSHVEDAYESIEDFYYSDEDDDFYDDDEDEDYLYITEATEVDLEEDEEERAVPPAPEQAADEAGEGENQ
ncbi:MAG: hypothetical protein Q4G61_03675 [Tissierellia bacterium]|nr:hypothetical protein [Tissierellia bacterium]